MKSNFKKINIKDIGKGFILAFITAFVSTTTSLVSTLISTGIFDLSWSVFKPGIIAAVLAGASYLVKNFFTNSKDQFAKAEPTQTPRN